MDNKTLREVLKAHEVWANGEAGKSAQLYKEDLSDQYLNAFNLSYIVLKQCNLSKSSLRYTKLMVADLTETNFTDADLSKADLTHADLTGADLTGATLEGANLFGAKLSGVKGLIDPVEFLETHFERTDAGYIVYKTFGGEYTPPAYWEIKPGSVITEVVNPDRTAGCGCGINVAPLEWVENHYLGQIWKCLLRWEWLAGVVVPYDTNGKIRCSRLELLEPVPVED